MVNYAGNSAALGVIPLREGERSAPVRIRAPDWVHNRLKEMSAAEIGQLLTDALSRPSESQAGPLERVTDERIEQALEELKDLVLLRVVSTDMGRDWASRKWTAQNIQDAAQQIRQGATLRRATPRGVWKTEQGQTVNVRRVAHFLAFGMVEPLATGERLNTV